MRLFAILLLVLIAGLGFALWRGIDLGTGRLAATEDLAVDEVELTAAEPSSEEAAAVEPEPQAEVATEVPAEAAEAPAEAAEAPAATVEAPAEATEAPAEPAEAPAAETAAVEAAPDVGTETTEAPAAETPDTAEAPAPRTLPEDPLNPTDALAEIAPNLSIPSAPPGRTAEPAEAGGADLASAAPDSRRVTGDRVNLRQGPDTGTASLGLLSRDDAVEVLETEDGWLRVRTEGGEEGWVAARFLATPPG